MLQVGRMLLATVGTRQRKDRRKRCLLYHPQLDGNNGRKSTGIFSGDHMSLHSQLRYDNLHLADLRHERNFLAAVTLGSLTVRLPDRWLDTIAAFFLRARSLVIPFPRIHNPGEKDGETRSSQVSTVDRQPPAAFIDGTGLAPISYSSTAFGVRAVRVRDTL